METVGWQFSFQDREFDHWCDSAHRNCYSYNSGLLGMNVRWWRIIIGSFLSIIAALIGWALIEVIEFKYAWEKDEAEEELQMLTPQEKVETLHHLEVAPTEGEFVEQKMINQQILKELKEMRRFDTLNADQIYQIKEEFLEHHKNQQ